MFTCKKRFYLSLTYTTTFHCCVFSWY